MESPHDLDAPGRFEARYVAFLETITHLRLSLQDVTRRALALNFSRQSLLIRDVTFRIVNWIMAALFAFAVVVQYNDPDPLVWMSIYAAAGALAAVRAYKGSVPLAAPAAVGLVALVWGMAIATGVPSLDVYASMFDAWEMRSVPIEEAREASGLLIVAFWMSVLALDAWRSSR